MNWYVYIVKCSDDSLYTGISTNVIRRIREHNNTKIGAKSLRGKLPVKLVHKEAVKNRIEASKRESEIKKLTRKEKFRLLASSIY